MREHSLPFFKFLFKQAHTAMNKVFLHAPGIFPDERALDGVDGVNCHCITDGDGKLVADSNGGDKLLQRRIAGMHPPAS